MITAEQAQAFDRDGYVLIENAFSSREIEILLDFIERSKRITEQTVDMPDSSGRSSKLSLWTEVSNDVLGAVTSSPRIVNSLRAILREDVVHFHSKVMLKEPRIGGSWEWHQDYGYWYNDGYLSDRLVSAMVALDPATRENGCLKVLTGTHHLGRIDHGRTGQQTGADPERIKAIEARYPLQYVETPPGSVLFFHSNLLHSSEANLSENPRRSYISCYSAASNIPYTASWGGTQEPMQLSADDAIIKYGEQMKDEK